MRKDLQTELRHKKRYTRGGRRGGSSRQSMGLLSDLAGIETGKKMSTWS